MYRIMCDDYVLHDPRIEDFLVLNPKCKLEVNTVGEASFTIPISHPHYDKLKKLSSIFEILHNEQVIFRGRMVNDTHDFYNRMNVELEGVLGFTNDSIISPFTFPADIPGAAEASNVVECFLGWLLEQHNAQVDDWKKLKLGTVTVSDPNNYLKRESTDYDTTWDILTSKLVDSGLGGYLVIRYEADGNYIDYLQKFELTNTQTVTFGKNLLDITSKSDASSTYSVVVPIGAEIEVTTEGGTDYEGDYVVIENSITVKNKLTVKDLPDGDLTDDLVKEGIFIYSKSAREAYGWICAPPDETTWDNITVASNLCDRAMEYLTGTGMMFSGNTTLKAVDLSFTDDQIESFRTGRNILVNSPEHGIANVSYPLTKLEIDIATPQNTNITIGETTRSMSGINRKQNTTTQTKVESVTYEVAETKTNVVEIQNQLLTQNTQIINSCNEIILSALESYVETSNFEEYKETVSTQLQILADEIVMNFTSVTEHITDVDGDVQNRFTEIYKYISFADGNITLGSNENAITLTIENDMIVFKKNGVQFGWWDGVDFHTGNIVVEVNERAQFGNFAFIPRSDGSLMFLKVGG